VRRGARGTTIVRSDQVESVQVHDPGVNLDVSLWAYLLDSESEIGSYNTYAREPGRRNGGQETNRRIHTLVNAALNKGEEVEIWYRVTKAEESLRAESAWMDQFGVPAWNRRDKRTN